MKRLTMTVALVVAVLVGCSGDGGGASTPQTQPRSESTTTTEAEPELSPCEEAATLAAEGEDFRPSACASLAVFRSAYNRVTGDRISRDRLVEILGPACASGSGQVCLDVDDIVNPPTTTTTTIPVEQIQTEIDAAATASCDAAGTSGMAPPVDYDLAWRAVAPESAVQQLANDCATARREEAIEAAGPIDVDALVRDPEAAVGQFFRIAVVIVQFDGATGPCTFRGYYDNQAHEYSFDYEGENAVFTSSAPGCPALDGLDNDDTAWMTVEGLGTITYDTQIGGSTTVPSFEVIRSDLVAKG